MTTHERRRRSLLLASAIAGLLGACGSPSGSSASRSGGAALSARAGAGHGGATLTTLTIDADDAAVPSRVTVGFERAADIELVEEPRAAGQPRRVWLAMRGVRLADTVRLPLEVGKGGLRSIDWDGERLAFSLDPDVDVESFVLAEPSRWVLDFRRTTAAVSKSDAPRPVRVVLLDPGHGGYGQGAEVGGLREADLVLDIAKRVSTILLQRLPGIRVLLTRHDDLAVALEDRTAMANSVEADLFVSIHLNDAPGRVEHGGVTTFVLDTRDARQEVRFAARENGTSEAEVTGMQRILADLHREGQLEQSRRLAELVQGETLRRGRAIVPTLFDRGVKSDVFSVLVGARMPAILVEASFMTRPEELEALRTRAYRQALAAGIAAGIVRYATPAVRSGTFLAAR